MWARWVNQRFTLAAWEGKPDMNGMEIQRPILHKCRRAVDRVRLAILPWLPLGGHVIRTRHRTWQITYRNWLLQKVCRVNGRAYWPVHPTSTVTSPRSIRIGVNTSVGRAPGCYIQGTNGMVVGDYTIVAPNVGLISANHDLHDLGSHPRVPPLQIGAHCWIGMNAVVLPGVVLGDHTVVAANSVVKDSFPEGYAVVAGAPARVVKTLDKDKVKKVSAEHEYIGFHWLKPGMQREEIYRKRYLRDPFTIWDNVPDDWRETIA